MDASTRFAKCFKITTENCKRWVLTFVEYKVCRHSVTLEIFIKSRPCIANHKFVAKALSKMNSSNDLDITALCAIIKLGHMLLPREDVSTGHVNKTAGDFIDRIRQTRNDIVHTGEADLAEADYQRFLNEFRDIAFGMEKINRRPFNTYRDEIDEIERQVWAEQDVLNELRLYNIYISNVVLYELLAYDSYTKLGAAVCSRTRYPVIQAVGGFCGGAVGLSMDLITGTLFGSFRQISENGHETSICRQASNDTSIRFAKCFKISTENCKRWVLTFVENKLSSYSVTLAEFIKSRPEIANHKIVARGLSKINSNYDLDITALCAIIKLGKLLLPTEKSSTGHVDKTAGDFIDRIRQTRNDIVHTGEAVLDEADYQRFLNEFRDIAMGMEHINGKRFNTYLHEIKELERQQWADQYVKDEIQLYEDYIEDVVLNELLSYDSFTKTFAAIGARTNFPVVQAVGGFVGGAVGLSVDIITGGVFGVSLLGKTLQDNMKRQRDNFKRKREIIKRLLDNINR